MRTTNPLLALPWAASRFALAISVLLALSTVTLAGEWNDRRRALDRVHAVEEFRLFYTFSGPDALGPKERADKDRDGVPDRVEDVATQLVAARTLYVRTFRLRHPLKSPRYKACKFIDVNLFGTKTDGALKGIAYDGVCNFRRPTEPDGGVKVICMDMRADIDTRNATPAHELFHLFQNSYTMFKNKWFTEGTARWAEFTLREGGGTPGAIPDTEAGVKALFKKDYDSAGFWIALAQAADPAGQLRIPGAVLRLRYVGDAEPVVADGVQHGAAFMKAILEELDRADDAVTERDGLKVYGWKESRQKSPENDVEIWEAVARVVERWDQGGR